MGSASASPSTSASGSPSASVSASASASTSPSASISQAIGPETCVTVEEAKLHLRITGTDDDALIEAYIDAATQYAQEYRGQKFLHARCIDFLDRWPHDCIRPRWAPLVSVTSITYIDSAGIVQTWSPSEYDVAPGVNGAPGRIEPAWGESWPAIRGDINGITVVYLAGYGASHDDVPTHVRHALLLLVAHWYRNRESATDLPLQNIPHGVRDLLGIGRIIPL